MLTRNSGRILFISSESAVHVTASQLHYAVTKTALLALSRGLAEMTRDTAVTVNVANVIAYLASPLASVTNGAVVRAEGGTVASIL
jgi:3-oxoacyl-[acyl-carrier protein] reductase